MQPQDPLPSFFFFFFSYFLVFPPRETMRILQQAMRKTAPEQKEGMG